VWGFANQGDLDVTITVTLKFAAPPELGERELEGYRTALVNINHGKLEARLVPVRVRKTGGA
jgi:hypothetical protein